MSFPRDLEGFEVICEEILANPSSTPREVEAVRVLAKRLGFDVVKRLAAQRLLASERI